MVTWCRSFNDIHRIMKTAVDYNVTEEFLDFKIIFKPEMDDAVDVSMYLSAYYTGTMEVMRLLTKNVGFFSGLYKL